MQTRKDGSDRAAGGVFERLLSLGINLQGLLAYGFGRAVSRRTRASGRSEPDPDRIRSVLVVRPDEIGDLILLSPLLRELRRFLPAARITLIVSPTARNLVELCPHVDDVRVYDQRVSRRWRAVILPWRAFAMAERELRRSRFDVAFVPRWDTDGYYAVWLAFFSGAAHRIGYSEKVTPRKQGLNRGFDRFLTEAVDRREPRHEVERNLDLLETLGAEVVDRRLELWLDGQDEAFAEVALQKMGSGLSGPVIAVHPGAGAPQRRWPVANFAALISRLQGARSARFVLIGGPGDRELGRAIARETEGPVLDTIGRASLRQTAALLKRCDLYVGNDTGPMHIAAAAGAAVVEISSFPRGGPDWHWNSPQRFGPWGVPSRVLQPDRPRSPCSEGCVQVEPHCITEITVDDAVAASTELLAQTRPAGIGETGINRGSE